MGLYHRVICLAPEHCVPHYVYCGLMKVEGVIELRNYADVMEHHGGVEAGS